MKNIRDDHLTDEALEALIASVEAEPMLRPPKGFKNEIIDRISQKRRYRKNLQLFSYSMKVVVATAAALGIMLIAPDNLNVWQNNGRSIISGDIDIRDAEEILWNKEAGKESEGTLTDTEDVSKKNVPKSGYEVEDKHKFGQDDKKAYDESFTNKLNKHMDEYLDFINGKLDSFLRMEVKFNEEEKE